MKDQVIEQIKLAECFSLQPDECTNIANITDLIVYAHFEFASNLKTFFLLHNQQIHLICMCSMMLATTYVANVGWLSSFV